MGRSYREYEPGLWDDEAEFEPMHDRKAKAPKKPARRGKRMPAWQRIPSLLSPEYLEAEDSEQ